MIKSHTQLWVRKENMQIQKYMFQVQSCTVGCLNSLDEYYDMAKDTSKYFLIP